MLTSPGFCETNVSVSPLNVLCSRILFMGPSVVVTASKQNDDSIRGEGENKRDTQSSADYVPRHALNGERQVWASPSRAWEFRNTIGRLDHLFQSGGARFHPV